MKNILNWSFLFIFLITSASIADEKTLDIYFLDMYGGGVTLVVTPDGQSVLIDSGWLDPKYKTADRITEAASDAGLKQIDYLITTHFDTDHYGAIYELSKRIGIRTFIDKGHLTPNTKSESFKTQYPLYLKATGGFVRKIYPGDEIEPESSGSYPDLKLVCVAAEKKIIGFEHDINAPSAGYEIKNPDKSDNVNSIAVVLEYGDFTFFAGGDITWNLEHYLVIPNNRIGQVDLYQVTHHGLDMSNNTNFLKSISPTVCVAMNGSQKGIQPRTFNDLKSISSIEAVYQIHYNTQYGDAGNTDAEYIANYNEPDGGRYIKASVNSRNKTFDISIKGKKSIKSYKY